MNSRAFTLALLIAGFAMFMVYSYVDDQKSEIVKQYGKMSSVVVAKENIKELDLIDDSKVTVISVPKNFLAPGSFKTVREVENTIATVPILKGEQITKPRVTFPGEGTGLSREVSIGKRAIAISINEENAVSKLIKPGDRVDILAPIDYAASDKEKQKIITILQDVRVLSTGRSISNNIPIIGVKTPKIIRKVNLNTYTSYNTVTLELDPYEVQKLVHFIIFSSFKPFLTLRNINDKKPIHIDATRLYDVLDAKDQEAAKQYFREQKKK